MQRRSHHIVNFDLFLVLFPAVHEKQERRAGSTVHWATCASKASATPRNIHSLAVFGQTFCFLWAIGNLSVSHLWQENPKSVGVAWESSCSLMCSEDECPMLFCLKFSLHSCPVWRKPYIKRISWYFWWLSWPNDKRAEKGWQAGWSAA